MIDHHSAYIHAPWEQGKALPDKEGEQNDGVGPLFVVGEWADKNKVMGLGVYNVEA